MRRRTEDVEEDCWRGALAPGFSKSDANALSGNRVRHGDLAASETRDAIPGCVDVLDVDVEAGGDLPNSQEFDVEDQRGIRRDDAADTARAVAVRRRNGQRPLAADLHAGDPFIPAADYFAAAKPELERFIAIAR